MTTEKTNGFTRIHFSNLEKYFAYSASVYHEGDCAKTELLLPVAYFVSTENKVAEERWIENATNFEIKFSQAESEGFELLVFNVASCPATV